MTTITSMEQFRSLDVGSVVTVGDNSNAWTKGDGGWTKDEFTLADLHFEGDITQRRITLGVRPEPGQVYSDEGHPNYGYLNILIEQVPGVDDQWMVAQFSEGAFANTRQMHFPVPGRLLTDAPTWTRSAHTMARRLLAAQRQVADLSTALTTARQQVSTVTQEKDQEAASYKTNLQSALHTYMHNAGVAPDSALGDILAAHGMLRPDQVVTVRVTVRGTSYVALTSDAVQGMVANVSDVEPYGTVGVRWNKDLTFEVETNRPEVCSCRLVSRRMVRERLREENVTFDDFSSEVRCPACQPEPTPEPVNEEHPF